MASSCGEMETTDLSLLKFNEFMEANDLPDITNSFSSLCHHIKLNQEQGIGFYAKLKDKLQQWRCKDLWKFLDTRGSQSEYGGGLISQGKRVLIIGAGPVGLRTAIEVSLLGAHVDVVEKRSYFSRNNVLHLWSYLIDDLKSLGAKKFYGKFCAGAIDHISIRKLQCVLLKICLILGVKIHYPVTFVDIIEPSTHDDDSGWKILTTPTNTPVSAHFYDAIIAADGKQYCLPGFTRNQFRPKVAIAITVNFINNNTQEEAAVDEISGVAYIYNQSFFKSLSRAHGIDLENIVYYKDETHYFVMTAKKSSLLEKGVLKNDYRDPEMLLSNNNIHQSSLELFAKEAVTFSTKGGLGQLSFAINHRGQNDVAIFDFTSLYASVNASRIMERRGKRLLLSVVGDSLLEPFWPTGSGLAKGFLGAFDTAWMFKRYSEKSSPLEIIEEREALYRLLPSTTTESLNKKASSYSINPQSRYANLKLITTNDISHLYDSDTNDNNKPRPLIKKEREIIPVKVKRSHTIQSQSPRHHASSSTLPPKKLESIRASLSPGPPEVKKRNEEEKKEEIKEIEKEEAVVQKSPSKKANSSNEFSLLKFAKLLFGGGRKKVSDEERKVNEDERREDKEVKRTVKTPERKRKKSREKRKSLTKLAETGDKNIENKEINNDISNEKNVVNEVSREKQSNEQIKTVQNLKQLYESNSTEYTYTAGLVLKKEMSTSSRSSGSGGSSNSSGANLQGRGVASVIKQYEIRMGGSNMIDGEEEKEEEEKKEEKKEERKEEEKEEEDYKEERDEEIQEKESKEENKEENKVTQFSSLATTTLNEKIAEESIDASLPSDREELNEEVVSSFTEHIVLVESSTYETGNDENILSKDNQAENIEEKISLKEDAPLRGRSHTISTNKVFTSPIRRYMSHDDSALQSEQRGWAQTDSGHYYQTPQWLQKLTQELNKCLELLREETPELYNVKMTLQVIKFIYNNIISDPSEETYRRVRVTSEHFKVYVYQYNGAVQFMGLSGWMQVNDYLLLPLEQSLSIPMKVLERQLDTVQLKLQSLHFDKIFHRKVTTQTLPKECYTDDIVSQAVSKASREHSKLMASALKESMTVTKDSSKEEIDSPTVTRKITRDEENRMMESAAQARQWWERKQDEPNNYVIYFYEEEIEEMKYIANRTQKGVVAERIKAFEINDEEEEEEGEEEEMSSDSSSGYSDNEEEAEMDQPSLLIKTELQTPGDLVVTAELIREGREEKGGKGEREIGSLNKDVFKLWEGKRQEIASSDKEEKERSSLVEQANEDNLDPLHAKWLQASRVNEEAMQKRLQQTQSKK